jgi:hypothetical protein
MKKVINILKKTGAGICLIIILIIVLSVESYNMIFKRKSYLEEEIIEEDYPDTDIE